jgi:hypothetical protein
MRICAFLSQPASSADPRKYGRADILRPSGSYCATGSNRAADWLDLCQGEIIGAEHRFQGSHAQCRCIVGKTVVYLLGLASCLHQIGPPQFGKLLAERWLSHASGILDVRHLPFATQQIGQDHETLRLSEHAQLLDRDVSERAGLVDRRHRSACVW